MDPKQRLGELKVEWAGCTKCHLSKLRHRSQDMVFGQGSSTADVVVVTDAPTRHDMANGGVLSTEDGALIQSIFQDAGAPLNKIYVTSVVGCHPYIILPATESTPEERRPREPEKQEIEACRPRLTSIIYTVDPRIIVALGVVAWKALVPAKNRLRDRTAQEIAGELYEAMIPGVHCEIPYPVLGLLSAKQIHDNPSTALHGPVASSVVAMRNVTAYVNYLKAQESKNV